jgi:hypothetical protein
MSGTLPPTSVYGAFSDYLEKKLLAHVFQNTPYTAPVELWVALYASAPTDAAPGGEPPGANGYARQAATFVAAPDGADGSSTVWNNAVLQFPTATGPWGTVAWVGIHDAVTAGNMLAWGPLAALKVIDNGDAVRFGVNTLAVGLQ